MSPNVEHYCVGEVKHGIDLGIGLHVPTYEHVDRVVDLHHVTAHAADFGVTWNNEYPWHRHGVRVDIDPVPTLDRSADDRPRHVVEAGRKAVGDVSQYAAHVSPPQSLAVEWHGYGPHASGNAAVGTVYVEPVYRATVEILRSSM